VRCRKNDLTECAKINDLIIKMGHETPENYSLTILKGFPTASADIEPPLKSPSSASLMPTTNVDSKIFLVVKDYW